MSTAAPASRWKIIVAFGLVYVFWGSTYLGIGIAVEQIPPAVMCAARFLIAGTVMLAYCAITGRRIRFSARQLAHFAAVGILLLMGGNLTLSYAEKIVPTGLAALLVAVTPLWFLVLDSLLLGDHHISRRGKIGLAIGIAGVVVLIWPVFATITLSVTANSCGRWHCRSGRSVGRSVRCSQKNGKP
jgi:drug/metabolite transporter (DMT)-like permease